MKLISPLGRVCVQLLRKVANKRLSSKTGKGKRGPRQALIVIVSHLLKEQQSYRELGPDHADEKAAEVARRRALRTLEQLGYDGTLQPTEVA